MTNISLENNQIALCGLTRTYEDLHGFMRTYKDL